MPETEKIRDLNDRFRTTLIGGDVLVTRGIAARDDLRAIMEKVRQFDQFDPKCDPHGEHDFGSFEIAEERFYFKIEAVNADLTAGVDPADPSGTRIITILLATEY